VDAIRTEGLTRRFKDLTAVNRLTVNVKRGEIFGLVGPDGAGKTTTMRMLSAILTPTDGSGWVMGYDIRTECAAVKDRIAYMSQQFGLYTDLTVMENIEFYADLYGVAKKGRRERIDELLNFSYMHPFKRRLAGNLSGGMKQKLQLMCALIHTPEVMLLDEPTNGVDPVSRRDFWRILYRLLSEGVTIFVSTAYLDEAERCNRIGLMHEGELIAQGTPSEVKKLMRGRIIAITSPEARRIAYLLKSELEAVSICIFGDSVHVVTDSPEKTSVSAGKIISESGLSADSIRSIDATLEDVFVSMLGEKRASAGAEDEN